MKAMVVVASLGLAACSGKDSSPPKDSDPDRGPAAIELSVDELLYEATAIDATASKTIKVSNVGGAELDVESVQVAAPFKTTFSYMTLQPGGVNIITVLFAPTTQGHFEEVLSVLSTDANHPAVQVTCVGDTITDADGDGFDAGFEPGEDCDDSNPNINPAAEEIWYNGVNDNCICENKRCSDDDQDLDGYDYVGENSDPKNNGGDCNDVNPDINPGAVDYWYDGYDTNCDYANDNDQDRDGYSSSEHTAGGTDCNDLDPEINIEGTETYDGEDDDCDDDTDYQILDASTAIMIIGGANDKFGEGLTSGQLDTDTTSEVIVGAPKYGNGGVITVFSGGAFPATGSVGTDTADAMIEGDSGDELGGEIAYLEDFAGTGEPHLVVGATNYSSDMGYAAVLLGSAVIGGSSLDDSTVLRIEGTGSGTMVGQGLANDLDLDGDGYDELLGSMKSGSDISLWLFAGDTTDTGVLTTAAADAQFDVTGDDTTMLSTFPGGGNDFDGDGYDDFLFCNGTGGEESKGEVWILWGGNTPYSNTDSEAIDTVASTVATGSSTLSLGFVCGSAGDWTGDGKAEVWMYSQSATDMYVLAGDDTLRDGPIDVTKSYLALYHFDSFTNDPDELRDVGDLDATPGAAHEMAISISSATSTVVPGQVYILGPDLGFGDVPDSVETLAQATFWGDEAGDASAFGGTISGHAADVTGASGTYRTDIVVADPGYLSNAGAVYVYPNYNE